MRTYPFKEKPLNQWLIGIFLFLLLFLSRDTMYGREVIGFFPSQMAALGLTFLAAVIFLICNRRNLKEIFTDGRVVMAGVFFLLFLIPMVIKQDWQLMYMSIVLYLLTALFLHYFLTLRQASRFYLVILAALSVYSLLATYCIRFFADSGLISLPIFANDTDAHFYQLGLSVVAIDFVTMRNFGIFREPGVYQFFLLLALFLNNYKADWEKPWQTWTLNGILAVTILSTFATGGIIELGLLVIFLFWDKKWYRDRRARIIAYVGIGVLAAGILYVLVTQNVLYQELIGIFGKFKYEKDTGESRIASILMDLDLFLRHPILGTDLRTVLHAIENNTTSTMIQYAGFGLLTGSLHVAAWAALAWDKKRCVIGNLLLLLILFMSFNTQNLIGSLFFWLFPILALLDVTVPRINGFLHRKAGN